MCNTNKIANVIICLYLLTWSVPIKNLDLLKGVIIHNVGQGQWVTVSTPTQCLHLDIGGEIPPKYVSGQCHIKLNLAVFSHWDWDHIGFIRKASKNLSNLCLLIVPKTKSTKVKQRLINSISKCNLPLPKWLKEIPYSGRKSENSNSRIFVVFDQFLFPGDSLKKDELVWSKSKKLNKINFLLLGHHGSQTSTSVDLLNQLPELKLTFSSARYKKYGHPHFYVEDRLSNRGLKNIKTESWGNIFIEFPLNE